MPSIRSYVAICVSVSRSALRVGSFPYARVSGGVSGCPTLIESSDISDADTLTKVDESDAFGRFGQSQGVTLKPVPADR